MFFWFIGTAIVAVGFVFRDPRFDYRLLVAGSVLPLLDGVYGGSRVLHSVTVSVALMAVLMIATAGRKPIRKLLLGLPIGMFLHLVFDGAWNNTDVFWWPFTGWTFGDEPFPVVDRGVVSIVLEAVGAGLCVWLWRANDLGNSGRRRQFLVDGRLAAVADRAR
ncbi:MAG: hypothetical protein HKN44_04305 [Ilumatobacter sp.]|nr:hypothetical protein [Ilumatobacter sp.]